MFQSNSRIEQVKGIRFYEQDILFDDYVFSEDIQITMTIDYVAPGIGIALMDNEGLSIREKNETYLFRIGYKEASIVYRLGDVVRTLDRAGAPNIKPFKENMKVVLIKRGKLVYLYADDKLIAQRSLLKPMDKYNIGIYSNAGNIIKDISIAYAVPDKWAVNMLNTNGGYVRFSKNTIELSGCEGNAEIEQSNILLDIGTYYLRYNKTDNSDIQSFVFLSDDDRIYDQDKNILKDNIFILNKKTYINLKFKGTIGSISNIALTDIYDDKYVATKPSQPDSESFVDGSRVEVNTTQLSQVSWTGRIDSVPRNGDYAVFSINNTVIDLNKSGVALEQVYDYAFNVDTSVLEIKKNGALIKNISIQDSANRITIFKNINAIISSFTLIRKDGEVINLIAKNTNKKYIPSTITSPIIAVDESNIPLDLSSSYRIVNINGIDKYIFTNTEREYFTPSNHINLDKRASKQEGTVTIYGIHNNAEINMKNMFRISKEGLDNIDEFADKYDIIYEKDMEFIDKISGDILLNNGTEYKMLIVDYLKQDSYCINFKAEMDSYEVDISTDKDVLLIYDHDLDVIDSKTFSSINIYKDTNIIPEDNCYIVLRRGDY